MLVYISAWVTAFSVLFPFEIGISGGGEGGELSVCVFVLVIKFSTWVWSACGACSWIWGSEALRKRMDHKSITIDHNSWVSSRHVVITVTDVDAVAQQRAEWGEGKGQPCRTLTSSGRAGSFQERNGRRNRELGRRRISRVLPWNNGDKCSWEIKLDAEWKVPSGFGN